MGVIKGDTRSLDNGLCQGLGFSGIEGNGGFKQLLGLCSLVPKEYF